MGASLMKPSPGYKEKETMELIQKYYDENLHDKNINDPDDLHHFYHAVCGAVQEINRKSGNTQIRIPDPAELEGKYNYYAKKRGGKLAPEDFRRILQELIGDAGFTNGWPLETFLYILAAPGAAVVVKNAVNPNRISNQTLIPAVTSATVFMLAALKKI